MRIAAGSAVPAARSIALVSWRVNMARDNPHFSTAKIAELGKVHVNRPQEAPLLAESGVANQAR